MNRYRGARRFFSGMIDHWESKGVKRADWGPVHFLGHSLGAHAAGQAAHYLKQQDKFRVNRITGLDPAEPCFEEPRETEPKRLSREDADFVDIVHTDGAVTRNAALGLMDPIGDLDFYIDGGNLQPDCMGAANEAKKRPEFYKYFLGYVKIARHSEYSC
ncbi:unnamed protein product [Trichogramma brassicae]|uniref:phospholipase A1 n=1 Tax=Trichogramma brassicae TaxID=86971 RepID=A0A6H5IZM4_9HYME|nr:unnamed protein product [Trichogramma brassicae]